ncbi:CinA family protein, partial [Thermodesulfovibrio sp.]
MSFLNSIAFDIVKNFTEKQKTLSTAESCTGGLVA